MKGTVYQVVNPVLNLILKFHSNKSLLTGSDQYDHVIALKALIALEDKGSIPVQGAIQTIKQEIADNLRRVGVVSGLTQDDVEACFKDGQKAQSLVAWSEENSKKDEITSTPSFIINGKKYANLSYLEFKQILYSE